jgi:hypothetical protein
MIEREYEYRLKSGRVMTRVVLMAAGGAWFAYMALTNDRALTLWIIPLTRNGATIFYAAFAALMLLISMVEAVNVLRTGSLRQRIAFTEDGVMVPKTAWTEEERLIPYESIVDLKENTEPIHAIVIRHRDGQFTLMLDRLPDERAFAEIGHKLAVRAREARAGAGGLPPAAT